MMHSRERITKSVVEKYKNEIYFMVDTNQFLMEVVEPRIVWIMPMGYEVDEKILDMYAQHLLNKPKDDSVERFGTYEDLDVKLHVEL